MSSRHFVTPPVPVRLCFACVSPEFCYRPGLSAVSEDAGGAGSAGSAGGAPTRPLPPTPDEDDAHGDRTLVMKRVSTATHFVLSLTLLNTMSYYLLLPDQIIGRPNHANK